MTLPIETERLLLRKYEDRDVADILEYSLAADFWLHRNLDWDATEESIRAWFEAGVAAVGIGSKLVTEEWVAAGDYDAITAKTAQLIAWIHQVRGESTSL